MNLNFLKLRPGLFGFLNLLYLLPGLEAYSD